MRINIESLDLCLFICEIIIFLFSVFFNGLDLKVFPLREGIRYLSRETISGAQVLWQE